jgi:hypothetical protein
MEYRTIAGMIKLGIIFNYHDRGITWQIISPCFGMRATHGEQLYYVSLYIYFLAYSRPY